MSLLSVFALLLGPLLFAKIAYRFVTALYTPSEWHLYPVCFIIRHDWSDPYRPDGDGSQPELKTCDRCGLDRRANPPAPLVP